MDLNQTAWLQSGVITREQALSAMTPEALRWKLRRGDWQKLYPGVYLTHTGEATWAARCRATLFHYGAGAALSMESAAYVMGIERQEPAHIHVDVPHPTYIKPVPGVRARRRRRLPVIRRGGLLVTEPAFTVLDLADHRFASRDDALAVAARAVQRRATTVEALAVELNLRRAHRHRLALQLALGAIAQGAESGLEVTYLNRVILRHGLPPMRLAVPDQLAGSSIRRDFENEEFGVVSEVDGRLGHEGEGRIKDARRDRKTLATGRVTVRQGWVDVHFSPCELAGELFCIYRGRGYRGGIMLCSPMCQVQRHIAALIA